MEAKMLGELRVLQRLNKYEMAVELDILRDGLIHVGGSNSDPDGNGRGPVRNWEYRNLEQHYLSFAGKPLLTAYIGDRVGDGHNSRTRTDPETGDRYESYTGATAERIVGMVSEDTADLSLIKRDGYTWERVKGRIWTNYAPELTEKLLRIGRMSVSVETNVLESRVEDGVEIMEAWDGLGVTLLGDGVAPAVPGANIRVLAAMQNEFEDMKLRVAALLREEENTNEEDNETKENEKEGVKRKMNRKLTKELAAKFPEFHLIDAQDNGEVILLSRNGVDAYSYRFEESDKGTVIPERIQQEELMMCVKTAEREIPIDITRVTGFYDTEIMRLKKENAELSERLEKLEQARKDAEARETARRVKASVSAAESKLAEINANRAEDERFEDAIIDGIRKRAEAGDYTVCVDGDGNWCGEAIVRDAVYSECMKAQEKMDATRKATMRSASRKKYAFEPDFIDNAPSDSFEALYASMVGTN